MDQKELNKQTVKWIDKLLQEQEDNTLVVAIVVNKKTGVYQQVVGYGVDIPLLDDAMKVSFDHLVKEHAKRNKS